MGKFIDLTGQKFNRLIVLERVNNKTGNRYKWKCQCECGSITLVDPKNLKNEHTKSCGCLQKESTSYPLEVAQDKYKDKYIIENTNIAKISQVELNRNNKSGYAGVHFHKQSQLWEARIQFQGKRYYLGRYEDKEDAIKARKEAENQYHKEFLEWYYKTYKKHHDVNNTQ